MQISFNIWDTLSSKEKLKNDIYIFFFIASCFIIIKVLIFLIINFSWKIKKK